jgi:hypothetical protein
LGSFSLKKVLPREGVLRGGEASGEDVRMQDLVLQSHFVEIALAQPKTKLDKKRKKNNEEKTCSIRFMRLCPWGAAIVG